MNDPLWEADSIYDGPIDVDWATIGDPAWNRMYLYLLRDETGQLLYTGITWSIKGRWHQHRLKKDWWGDVHAASVFEYRGDSAGDAEREIRRQERRCITALEPLHNITRPAKKGSRV
jgi:predicted GIY-YIG superfamily endonuclease